jgi:GNAT superfamily N-acetyltransferase
MPTTPLYRLKDYKESFKFEKEHPKELRWDDKYKLYMLQENDNCQGIWLRLKLDIIGEVIMSWESGNVVYIESFTVMPEFKGQGYGHDLIKLAIDWATESGYKYITGEARKGASWKIFQNFGATQILTYENWGGTKEEYISFKIEL